jgi:AP-1 complex subunit gamma-1
MSMKLRDLIRKVRACKTASEERAVIAKESAMIRTAIREEQAHFRHRNVAKLLFMHMLGYPTHFGQLECMKLTASPHFPEKRIGYLGMMLLLSEQADVLMLATNALKNDLTSDNKFIAGLALCTIGNLATADMSRDLAPEVDKHLKSANPYLRKKACLAMARCLSKCPDMVEDFVDRVVTLLKDKSHGVLVTVVQLMTQVFIVDVRHAEEEDMDPLETDCRKAFMRLVPTLVKMLRNLLNVGYSPDHDVAGISDPFLQVQLLTLLRLLGANDKQASEEMNDVLAQVASNTETAKNAGNAILYECVLTIMGTESEDGLRVLAVNILGRFLLQRDNNIRYVALNTLARCIVEQKQSGRDTVMVDGEGANNAMSALQRHRTTVVDCLKDPDISIRQRALELICHLVNQENVESLIAELLSYLVLCPREHRAEISNRVLKVVDKYSPDDRWRVDTLITTLTIAGREASTDVQNATAIYISRATPDVHAFATHKLLKAIRDDDGGQHGLMTVGVWCIGEYGDLLLQPCTYTPSATTEDSFGGSAPITMEAMEPMTIVQTIQDVTEQHGCPDEVKQRVLTAYAKLSQRLATAGDPAALIRLEELLKKHSTSHSLELQLRSCEYNALISACKGLTCKNAPVASDDIFGVSENGGDDHGGVSSTVISAAKDSIARMPVVDLKVLQKRLARDAPEFGSSMRGFSASGSTPTKKAPGGDLLDFDDLFGGGEPAPEAQQNGSAPAASGGQSDMDMLTDIFSSQATPAPTAAAFNDPFAASQPQNAASAAVNPLDLFGAPPAASAAVPSPFGAMPSASAPVPAMNDLFGGSTQAAPAPALANDMFGAAPTATSPVAAPAASGSVKVLAFQHAGLSAEFECTKPDTWNKQKSILVAHFKNSTGAPIHGMNLQVAAPKYVTLEMEPPSSTTIPVSGGNAKAVTQKVTITNTMLGTKNLTLKVKVGFSSNGQKIDHLATCTGFPSGEY